MLTYYVEDQGQGPEDAVELKSPKMPVIDDLEHFAEEAAEYCYRIHGGWEWHWPVVFAILKDGTEVGRYSVELEAVPQFYASPVKLVKVQLPPPESPTPTIQHQGKIVSAYELPPGCSEFIDDRPNEGWRS